jgi:two-component system sensor histidine kinase/response regulator
MRGYRILVIEDTKNIRSVLKDILTLEGAHVITAKNGQKGIDKAREHLPDLILCDIMLPKKNGYEVYDEIKIDSNLLHTPFLFLTAKTTAENRRQGMIMGADDYITKPFNIDLLIKSINTRLYKQERRKQIESEKFKTLQYNISCAIPHELLTPLNGIIGFSGLMIDPDFEIKEKQVRDFSLAIYNSSNRLLSTIQKFIYYTEIELLIDDDEKKMILKEEIARKADFELEEQSKIIAKKFNRESDIELNIKPFDIKISSFHFVVIIANILDNSFKFSNKGDKVTVEVELKDTLANITIIDNGLGFDGVKLKEIGAFSQFNRSKLEQLGLGLGLITSKKLINYYDGELSISQNKPKGSRIKLSFLLAD